MARYLAGVAVILEGVMFDSSYCPVQFIECTLYV